MQEYSHISDSDILTTFDDEDYNCVDGLMQKLQNGESKKEESVFKDFREDHILLVINNCRRRGCQCCQSRYN